MRFDIAGRLESGFVQQTPEAIIQTGKPFQTSGCAGCQNDVSACNRPYGDCIRRTSCHSLYALDAGDVVRVQGLRQSEEICA